jgi:hypothetical protein
MRMKFSFENHMISFEIICNHMRLFQPGSNQIPSFPNENCKNEFKKIEFLKNKNSIVSFFWWEI